MAVTPSLKPCCDSLQWFAVSSLSFIVSVHSRIGFLSVPSLHGLCAQQEPTSTAADTDAMGNDTSASSPVATTKEMRTRKKTFRVPLTVAGPGFAMPPMTPEQLKVCCACPTKGAAVFVTALQQRKEVRNCNETFRPPLAVEGSRLLL